MISVHTICLHHNNYNFHTPISHTLTVSLSKLWEFRISFRLQKMSGSESVSTVSTSQGSDDADQESSQGSRTESDVSVEAQTVSESAHSPKNVEENDAMERKEINGIGLKMYTDRKFLIREQQQLIEEIANRPKTSSKEIQSVCSFSSSITENISPAKVELIPVNRINIANMMKFPDKILYGKFLLCRTITPPVKKGIAVLIVVDDPETNTDNKAVCVALYNFMSQENEDPAHILPPGTLLAIKNPSLKLLANGSFIVRCEHPTDIRIFSEKTVERMFPNAIWRTEIPAEYKIAQQVTENKTADGKDDVYWKSLGDYLLQKCRYSAALEAYDKTLECKPYDLETMVKRSEIYLRVKNYDKCLNDAFAVLEEDPAHEEAFYHKIHSLVGLRQYEDAVNSLQWYIKHNRRNKQLSSDQLNNLTTLLKKVKICEHHQKTGKYDLGYIMRCPRNFLHECGEYIGPVEIVMFESKGRGTVARKSISAGSVIHCTKAFAMGFPDDNISSSFSQEGLTSTKSESILTSPFHKLVTAVAQRIMNDPLSGKLIYKLYAGPDLKWLDSNSDDSSEEQVTSVDMKRIDGICTFNAFYGDAGENGENDRCCGIWTISSFINHSCYDSNCTWRMHGDLLIIRATKDIAKGDEILTTYISPCELYHSRQQTFSSYGFVCKCSLCAVDAEESYATHQRRRHFLRKFDKIEGNAFKVADANEIIQIMEYCIEELIDLRPSNPHMNVYIVNPLHQLALYYYMKEQYTKAANILKHAHGIVKGTVLIESSLSCSINIVNCYLKAKNIKKAKKAAKLLERDLYVAYGKSASIQLLSVIAEEADLVDDMNANKIVLHFPKSK